MVEYKRLLFLRKNTTLDLVNYIKVKKLRREAEETQFLINKLENCQLGVDYSKADEYEYEKRFSIWMANLYTLWTKHGDGLDLFDYALIALDQNISIEEEEKYERIHKQRIK